MMSFSNLLPIASRASQLLKAMGNERRLCVLCHLAQREWSVNELCSLVELSQSALSQHLAKLRRDGLVKTRREAQTVYYSIATSEVVSILDALSDTYLGGDSTRRRQTGGDRAVERDEPDKKSYERETLQRLTP